MRKLLYFLFEWGDSELIDASIRALNWMRHVRQVGDGRNDGTIEQLERALRPYIEERKDDNRS